MQLELPGEVSSMVAHWAAGRGVPVVLNASPLPATVDEATDATLRSAATLVVNRAEAAALAGRSVESAVDANDAAGSSRPAGGVATVVVTLGAAGALCRHREGIDYHPGWPVKVVDTVGAGDAFLAAMVAARLEGRSIPIALQRGTAAGALATTAAGATAAMPDAPALDAFIARGPVHRGATRPPP